MPAILAIAYHSLVGSSGPVSSASSRDRLRRELADRCSDEPRNSSFSTPAALRRVDDVGLDHQVVVEEVGRVGVVGEDAADLGRGEEDHVGPRRGHEPALDRGLVA